MKTCSKCGEDKELSEYYKRAKAPDGLTFWCKSCNKKYSNVYHKEYIKTDKYIESKEKYNKSEKGKKRNREYQRIYIKTDKAKKRIKEYNKTEKMNGYHREYNREYYKNEEVKEKVHARNMASKIPLPEDMICQHCLQVKQKLQRHHYKGYEPEHALDVEFLCIKCHIAADKEQAIKKLEATIQLV